MDLNSSEEERLMTGPDFKRDLRTPVGWELQCRAKLKQFINIFLLLFVIIFF